MMAMNIGYVLPWGQMSFWGNSDNNLFSAIPLVGEVSLGYEAAIC